MTGPWKETLLELKDCDVRGPGREAYECSESRHIQSWIWVAVPQTSTTTLTLSGDILSALRVEWCKGQERAKQYEEEVQLVVEEMRRTLAYFEWERREWEISGSNSPRLPTADAAIPAGVSLYAYKQAEIQRRLIESCLCDWYNILQEQSLGSSWLKTYPRPQDNGRHRLCSNVQLYHSPPVAIPANAFPLDNHTIPTEASADSSKTDS